MRFFWVVHEEEINKINKTELRKFENLFLNGGRVFISGNIKGWKEFKMQIVKSNSKRDFESQIANSKVKYQSEFQSQIVNSKVKDQSED